MNSFSHRSAHRFRCVGSLTTKMPRFFFTRCSFHYDDTRHNDREIDNGAIDWTLSGVSRCLAGFSFRLSQQFSFDWRCNPVLLRATLIDDSLIVFLPSHARCFDAVYARNVDKCCCTRSNRVRPTCRNKSPAL